MTESDAYVQFVEDLRRALSRRSKESVVWEDVKKKEKIARPVLEKQTGDDRDPPEWVHVVLKGKGTVAPTVAIRNDKAYVFAFTNGDGKCFKLTTKNKEKVPPLSAAALWNYKKKTLDGDGDGDVVLPEDLDLKKQIAIICVTLSKAARFNSVCSVVKGGWDSTTGGAAITDRDVNLLKNWDDLSTAMIGWMKDKDDAKWFKNVKATTEIDTMEKAVKEVQIVLNKPPPSSLLDWIKYLWGLLVAMIKPQKLQENYHNKAA
ncbi:hypothetical protein E2562_016587 [Oryza meyeriana var. granulata]|uniref:rRNA N-glycosylase n=1 Tax=Oryza meyeriana var. granulata TaxID=110450 RepID=A0A6G1C6I2_9ORYZ|nr:hypothetical protein E2562_016587 [Oryza meyeriana var. granulata]